MTIEKDVAYTSTNFDKSDLVPLQRDLEIDHGEEQPPRAKMTLGARSSIGYSLADAGAGTSLALR